MNNELRNFILFRSAFFLSLAALIVLTVLAWPGSKAILFREDGIIESASAAAYAIAAILGLTAIYRGALTGRSYPERISFIAIPVLGTICFLDEISFGARLFDLAMPRLSGGGEFDGAHDLFIVLHRLILTVGSATRLFIYTVAGLLVLTLLYLKRSWIYSRLQWFAQDSVRRCLGSALVLLTIAVFLDLLHGRLVSSLEEFTELSAALFLAAAGFRSLSILPTASASSHSMEPNSP